MAAQESAKDKSRGKHKVELYSHSTLIDDENI